MTLVIDRGEDETAVAPISQEEIQSILEAVLADEGVERTCYVSVTIATDDEIRAQNLEWRGIDAPTDVISLECEYPDAFIERQAADFSTTPADEFRIMLVHGMLHLLGYDHLDDEEAQVMEEVENGILAAIATDAPSLTVEFTRHDEDGDAV